MAQWRSELRVSAYAKRTFFFSYAIAILLLLLSLAFCPATLSFLWVLFFFWILLECKRSWNRIQKRTGQLRLLNAALWHWQEITWISVGRPFILPHGILLTLCSAQGAHENLWIMRDSIDETAWRELRLRLFFD